jgi:hypothetical protein
MIPGLSMESEMTTFSRIRVRTVMWIAALLKVPVDVHQTFFAKEK